MGSKIAKTWCVRGKAQKLNLVWKLQESKIHKEGFFNSWGNGFCIASLSFAKTCVLYMLCGEVCAVLCVCLRVL